jgi:hypothetical protein
VAAHAPEAFDVKHTGAIPTTGLTVLQGWTTRCI